MFIVSESVLRSIQATLVEAAHGVTDEMGNRALMSTIEDKRLEMAALVGLQVALGAPVWPASHRIKISRRPRYSGPFDEVE